MRNILLPSLFGAGALLIAADAAASRYQDCISLVEADIEIGRIAAQQWVSEGGGSNARHCLAIADLKAGFPKLAAVRLEEVAERKDAGDDYMRARLYSQAAEAWLEAEEPQLAEDALKKAFQLTPQAGELHLTAAHVYAAQERWQAVIDAVDKAEEADFASAKTYVFRGKAYASLGNYQTAAQDVVNALSIDPVNVDALVLRGELQQAGIVIDVFYEAPDNDDSSEQ